LADYIITLETINEDIPIVECLIGRKRNAEKDFRHNPSCGSEIKNGGFTEEQVSRVKSLKVSEVFTKEMRDMLIKKGLFAQSANMFHYSNLFSE